MQDRRDKREDKETEEISPRLRLRRLSADSHPFAGDKFRAEKKAASRRRNALTGEGGGTGVPTFLCGVSFRFLSFSSLRVWDSSFGRAQEKKQEESRTQEKKKWGD